MKAFFIISVSAAAVALSASGCVTIEARTRGDGIAQLKQTIANITGSGGSSKTASIAGDINAAAALQFLYGNVTVPQPGREHPLWREAIAPKDAYTPQNVGSEYAVWRDKKAMAVHAVFEGKYTEQGTEKYVLLTQALDAENHCRACAPAVGAVVFAKEGGHWRLIAENKKLDEFGTMGVVLGKMDVARIGPEKYGVIYEGAHGAHQDCDGAYFKVITLQGTISSVDIGEDGGTSYCNEYCKTCTDEYVRVGEWDTRIGLDTSSSGEYYDVLLQSSYRKNARTKKASSKTRRYRFMGGKYKEVKTSTAARRTK